MCVSVCLSVSVCKISKKSYERIWMKFRGVTERGPGMNRLDFGGHPVSFADPGSFSRIFTARCT